MEKDRKVGMPYIRMKAQDQVADILKYPTANKRKRDMTLCRAGRITDHCNRRQYRLGFNACLDLLASFPECRGLVELLGPGMELIRKVA